MKTEKNQNWLNSYSVKMFVVSALALFLLIPSFWIQEIINERIKNKKEVESQLAAQWGNIQVVSGPVLNVPITYFQPKEDENTFIEKTAIAHFLPETLKVNGEIIPEIRYRGIYSLPVYQSKVKISGNFMSPDFNLLDISPDQIKWEDAFFTIGVSDLRGINNIPEVLINQTSCSIEPGVANSDLFGSGVTTKCPKIDPSKNIDFEINMDLNGSSQFKVQALGKKSEIEIHSKWSDPSFTGDFLPSERVVNSNGFRAQWSVTHLNRNFPQQWVNKAYGTQGAEVGTELLLPIDHYQKATRSVKYAILFIALNFIVFLFIEIKNRKKIHPFQYSLVAFALLLFYTLLTSISEQIGFNTAFLISAFVVTALISWYSYTILKTLKPVLWITLLQLGLYLFLFTILQLQDYALLMGSIGLFVILVAIMKASQKIKWYNDPEE